jgi:pimeloyl-ACP methyl ester carboxylesterase
LASELRFERDGVRIAGIDFGGDGPPALLLHGLAGYAGEWTATARWLTERCRVVALDARGHGGSERHPADVSRAAHVADAAFAVAELRLDHELRTLGRQQHPGRRRRGPGPASAVCPPSDCPTATTRAYWEEWGRIRCPVLVVRAGEGSHISDEDARAMAQRAQLVELPGAGHDVHLERPAEWRGAVSAFLDALE